jgi:hypothetical protein
VKQVDAIYVTIIYCWAGGRMTNSGNTSSGIRLSAAIVPFIPLRVVAILVEMDCDLDAPAQ